MAMDVNRAVRAVCLSFPEAEETVSHGMPHFQVGKKSFAVYSVNHHGDGRVALLLKASREAQAFHCETEPRHFFVPPYTGPRGWLGVHLDKGLSWKRIAELAREAYRRVAPSALAASAGDAVVVKGPVKPLTAVQIDPLKSKRAQAVLKGMRKLCLALPEATEDLQFGSPVFRAGKKTFAGVHAREGRVSVTCWVGQAGQAIVSLDERYRIPAYMGHNGWIALDVSNRIDWDELEALVQTSYRHFALKRMLRALARMIHEGVR